jgi:NDP-sugar pyrophosphorylase family protein
VKAMILAAGRGTRLRPLTNNSPKALVEIAGRTLLQIALQRLGSFGIRDFIVNTHHFADAIREYLQKNDNFGLRIEISREEELLDTGGGLKKASWFFADDSEPFLLHNVDVISTIDLRRMLQFHQEHQPLATLAVQARNTSRSLLFDEQGHLRARQQGELPPGMLALAFSGVHVISPRLLAMITEEGAFSILDSYCRLAAQGERLLAFRADNYYWQDLGKPENLLQAEKDIQSGKLQLA